MDMDTKEIDAKVENLSSRKGYVDLPTVHEWLRNIVKYLQSDGILSLTSDVKKKDMN